ncbi:hypothetical protein [Algoriphagus marinus]|uniref:hypothetical protein n=1 Tax=Algoriphagus marinus TaxID=1925762 RepID=UPI00094B8F91|nr:hypothetical protein [Algoriphagus marinus]
MRLISPVFYLSFLFLLCTACIKDVLSPEINKLEPEIVAARQWIQQNQNRLDAKAMETKSESLDPKFLTREIIWNEAVKLTDPKNRTVIEVPVHYPKGMVFGVSGNNPPPKSIRTSLILVKNGPETYVPYFLKVYSADPAHVFNRTNFFEVSYLNIPASFSGEFNFYNWDESWEGTVIYKEGKRTGNRYPKKPKD